MGQRGEIEIDGEGAGAIGQGLGGGDAGAVGGGEDIGGGERGARAGQRLGEPGAGARIVAGLRQDAPAQHLALLVEEAPVFRARRVGRGGGDHAQRDRGAHRRFQRGAHMLVAARRDGLQEAAIFAADIGGIHRRVGIDHAAQEQGVGGILRPMVGCRHATPALGTPDLCSPGHGGADAGEGEHFVKKVGHALAGQGAGVGEGGLRAGGGLLLPVAPQRAQGDGETQDHHAGENADQRDMQADMEGAGARLGHGASSVRGRV